MKKVFLTGLACAGSLALASGASALTISDSDSVMDQLTELVNEQLTVDLFDDMGGSRTLTKVTVTLGGSLMSDGDVENVGAGPATFNVSTTGELFQGTPDGAPAALGALDVFPVFGGTVIHDQTYISLTPNSPAAFGPGSVSDDAVFMSTDAGELAQFVGIGTFDYLVNTIIGQSVAGGGGNVNNQIMTTASAVLTVEYEFDEITQPPTTGAVPEPITATLGLMGIGALAATSKRRR